MTTEACADPYDALLTALADLESASRRWPCRDRREWISDAPADRAYAAAHCQRCPVLELCAAAATDLKPAGGVWAGTQYTTPPKRGKP